MEALNSYINFDAPVPTASLVLGAVLLALLVVVVKSWRSAVGASSNRSDLETRNGHPLIGNLLEVGRNRDTILEYFIRCIGEKKTDKQLSLTLPGRRLIDCSKPEFLEYIQKTGFQNFAKGEAFHDNTKQLLGSGIFSTDGARWKTQRQATSRIFSTNAFRGIITDKLERNLEKLLQIIRVHADSGEPFELDQLFYRFTLSAFSEMALGIDAGTLNIKDPKNQHPAPFPLAFDRAQAILDSRFTNPFWRITELFDGKAARMRAACKIIDEFAFGIIDQREKAGLQDVKTEKAKEDLDLLSLYMALRDETGKPLDRQALRDSVLNLIIAARDTTASGLAWTFYRLLLEAQDAKADDVSSIEKMRREVDEVGAIDYDTFKSLAQVNAVFAEGLRLSPSVAKNIHTCLKDTRIPGGPMVKKGEFVFWSDFLMARDTSIWGSDALKFNPSRWIDEEGQLKRESQWKAHAFNGGYRSCVGRTLAEYEAAAVLAAIVKEFDLSFAPGYLDNVKMMDRERVPRYAPSLTLPLLEPLRVVAARRKKA